MKRIELALLLTCFCFLFTACEHDDFPEPETIESPSGYIMAGETGDRVQVWNFGNQNSISGFGPTSVFEHTLDGISSGKIRFSTYALSFQDGYSNGSSISSGDSQMEFAALTITDTFWICYDLAPDSSSGNIYFGNDITEATCSGQLYFDYVDSIQSPVAFEAGLVYLGGIL